MGRDGEEGRGEGGAAGVMEMNVVMMMMAKVMAVELV